MAHRLRSQTCTHLLLAHPAGALLLQKHFQLPLQCADSGHPLANSPRPPQPALPQSTAVAPIVLRHPSQGRYPCPLCRRYDRIRRERPWLAPAALHGSCQHPALHRHAFLHQCQALALCPLHAASGGLCHLGHLAPPAARVRRAAAARLLHPELLQRFPQVLRKRRPQGHSLQISQGLRLWRKLQAAGMQKRPVQAG